MCFGLTTGSCSCAQSCSRSSSSVSYTPWGERGSTSIMCSRKAFSSRGLLAKIGMNSSELALNQNKDAQSFRRTFLTLYHSGNFRTTGILQHHVKMTGVSLKHKTKADWPCWPDPYPDCLSQLCLHWVGIWCINPSGAAWYLQVHGASVFFRNASCCSQLVRKADVQCNAALPDSSGFWKRNIVKTQNMEHCWLYLAFNMHRGDTKPCFHPNILKWIKQII